MCRAFFSIAFASVPLSVQLANRAHPAVSSTFHARQNTNTPARVEDRKRTEKKNFMRVTLCFDVARKFLCHASVYFALIFRATCRVRNFCVWHYSANAAMKWKVCYCNRLVKYIPQTRHAFFFTCLTLEGSLRGLIYCLMTMTYTCCTFKRREGEVTYWGQSSGLVFAVIGTNERLRPTDDKHTQQTDQTEPLTGRFALPGDDAVSTTLSRSPRSPPNLSWIASRRALLIGQSININR
jgi:hypothetical protein